MYKIKHTRTVIITHDPHFLESGKEVKVPSLPSGLTGQTTARGLVWTPLEFSVLMQTGAWTHFIKAV